MSKEEWREYTKTVWQIANVTNQDHPAVFPVEIPRRLIKMFSFVEETVLDPFAGTGTTASAAIELDRRAICIEQNPVYSKLIRRGLGKTRPGQAHVWTGDSRRMNRVGDESIDLVVTSPPYWNKANYGGNGADLGKISTYAQFLREITPVFRECLRVLRPGRKLCVVTANVNQHTNHGLLTFPLAADFAALLRDEGFVMVSEIIWSKDKTGGRWGSAGAQRPIFGSYPYPPNFLFKTVHEHILVFAKPPTKPTRGPKVVLYETLMELPKTPVDFVQDRETRTGRA